MAFLGDGTRAAVGNPDIGLGPIAWANGANPSNIGMTFDPFTQFSTPSSISSLVQDGSGSGSVVSFNVETDGTLFATLDNGETAVVGQIGMATFGNPEALRRTGESLYTESQNSGQPVIGTAQTGRFGGIEAGALELSTSDIASDFIKLISIQRGFQGSSRIISNIDDLLNEIINLA
jgi:flagellar hook protein FlgE